MDKPIPAPAINEQWNGGKCHIHFDSYSEEGLGGGYVSFYPVPGNCKMGFIDSVGGINIGTDEQKKAKLDYVLTRSEIIVYLNTHMQDYAEFIKNNYELYAYNEVPVGYGNGYQYHIIIRNTLSTRSNKNYLRPVEAAKTSRTKKKTKNKIKGLIEGVLKKYRRKTDIAGTIMTVIQDNAEG